MTPESITMGGTNANAANRTESPYVEGCSPIKSSSPIRPPTRGWALSPTFSPAPEPRDCHRQSGAPAPPMDVEAYLQPPDCCLALREAGGPGGKVDLVPMEENRNASAVNMADAAEEEEEEREDDCAWNKDAADGLPVRLTSSRTASMFNVESSPMFGSLLTEGNTMPYDNSMQVSLFLKHRAGLGDRPVHWRVGNGFVIL